MLHVGVATCMYLYPAILISCQVNTVHILISNYPCDHEFNIKGKMSHSTWGIVTCDTHRGFHATPFTVTAFAVSKVSTNASTVDPKMKKKSGSQVDRQWVSDVFDTSLSFVMYIVHLNRPTAKLNIFLV